MNTRLALFCRLRGIAYPAGLSTAVMHEYDAWILEQAREWRASRRWRRADIHRRRMTPEEHAEFDGFLAARHA